MSKSVNITYHAKERLTERADIHGNKEQSKLFKNALNYGYCVSQFTGPLYDYLQAVLNQRKYTNVKVFLDKVFIYRNKTLITSWNLPDKYIPSALFLKKHDKLFEEPVFLKLYKILDRDKLEFNVILINSDDNNVCYTTSISYNGELIRFGSGKDELSSYTDAIESYLKKLEKREEHGRETKKEKDSSTDKSK